MSDEQTATGRGDIVSAYELELRQALSAMVDALARIATASTTPYIRNQANDALAIAHSLLSRKSSSTPLDDELEDSAPSGHDSADKDGGGETVVLDKASPIPPVDPLSFEYRCTACGARQVGRSDHAGETCPTCGEGVLRLAVDAPAVAP